MFETIIAAMKSKFAELPDACQPSNGTKYEVLDAVLSAYSVFFMQSPSFLAHEQDRKRERGKNNLESLFGVHKTPTTSQIKHILDRLPPKEVGAVFWTVYEQLTQGNYWADFRGINGMHDLWDCQHGRRHRCHRCRLTVDTKRFVLLPLFLPQFHRSHHIIEQLGTHGQR